MSNATFHDWALRSTAVVAVGLLAAAVCTAEKPSFTNLGKYDVAGVSGDGQTVFGPSFRWTPGGGFDTSGSDGGVFAGASFDASVMAGTTHDKEGNESAGRWTAADGWTSLGSIGEKSQNGRGTSVSKDGSVIAGYDIYDTDTVEAFLWTKDNGMAGLGRGPYNGGSWGNGISGDGTHVAGRVKIGLHIESCAGVQLDLRRRHAQLPGSDPVDLATGISDDGLVIVGLDNAGLDGYHGDPAFWINGKETKIKSLAGLESNWLDTNGDGSIIVGDYVKKTNKPSAFLWTSANDAREIVDVLQNDYALDTQGLTLTSAFISDDGLTLAGDGLDPSGAEVGWVAHIPEPATIWLVAATAAVLRRRR